MTRPARVAILGGGKLAHAALGLLARAGVVDVSVAVRSAAAAARLSAAGARVQKASDAVAAADVVIIAVPAPAVAEVVDVVGAVARGDQVVLHASRGVGPGAVLPSEMIKRATCWKKIAVLGGPLYVDDAAAGRALQAAIGCRFDEGVRVVRALVGDGMRLSPTRDVIGVEVAGAVSNVGHLAAGLAAGAGFGDTDQSLLHVRALLEAARYGVAHGAERATFNGLAGIGDLIPRHVTSTRLHREAGQALARGDHDDETAGLEGVVTAVELAAAARKLGIALPLTQAVAAIFEHGASAKDELTRVLALDLGLQAA